MIGDILQPTHLLFIFVIALLVLGPKKLPDVGRQLGNGLRDFRAAINGERSERRDEVSGGEHGPPSTAWDASSDTSGEHEFAGGAAEPLSDEHSLGIDARAPDATAHEPSTGVGTEASAGSGGAHEFASQPVQPPGREPDPRT